ncbi:VOC family protein [Streptomyces albogriseolus]|uniref:VOC family protein n=1 Tax=Streptomyces albogriseolus TaxID=1887 RepID=UPI0033B711A6
MAPLLNPYLNFDGNARQAMEYYRDVFGGELSLHTFGEVGGAGEEYADKVMHGMLTTPDGFTIMGSDGPPGMEHTSGNNFAVSLSGEEEDTLRGFWEKLSDGGQVSVPLERQMWGDIFGMCTDRFDVPWMVNINTREG